MNTEQQQPLALQVGKTYRSRRGELVRIVGLLEDSLWPFIGDNDRTYTANGVFFTGGLGASYDLKEEVPAAPKLQLKVGKSYIDRSGALHRIVEARDGAFVDAGGWCYLADGVFAWTDNSKSCLDLEQEVCVPEVGKSYVTAMGLRIRVTEFDQAGGHLKFKGELGDGFGDEVYISPCGLIPADALAREIEEGS